MVFVVVVVVVVVVVEVVVAVVVVVAVKKQLIFRLVSSTSIIPLIFRLVSSTSINPLISYSVNLYLLILVKVIVEFLTCGCCSNRNAKR